MKKLTTTAALMAVVLMNGCATPSPDGIVQIGTDTYKVGSAGRFADYSSSAIKARLYQDAYKHCAAKNRLMVPVSSASESSAAPELQFRCQARNEVRLPNTPASSL